MDLGRGIVVLGMHRSGTSAVTGVLDSLGLHACTAEDRFPARRWNARGNFESRSLTRFDEFLLGRLGGSWWSPPELQAGWENAPGLDAAAVEGAALFAAAHPLRPWVWKDPRACLLMPFWDRLLGRETPRVLVVRNPVESAASLAERNGMDLGSGLGLADVYMRRALMSSEGRRVFITDYDDLLADAGGWAERASEFLRSCGFEPAAARDPAGLIDVELRHQVAAANAATPDHAAIEIWRWAVTHKGAHSALSLNGLPSMSARRG